MTVAHTFETDGIALLAVVAAAALILSYTLVGVVRGYAIRADLLDRPNDRSSHRVPTPRGGGLGAVSAFLTVAAGAATLRGALSLPFTAAAGAIAGIAALGWVDDRRSLPVLPRLAAHAAAGVVVAWLAVRFGVVESRSAMGVVSIAWWIFWSVSAINVVNFMDGIDGLIASQVALFAVAVAFRAPEGSAAMIFALPLASACVGFLGWNWAPARIFLGDVGSGALGLASVVAGLLLLAEGRVGLVAVYLPLLPLFLDAAVTIVRRALSGERLTSPHRCHLYQRLANGGWGHARVSAAYAAAATTGAAAALVPATARAAVMAAYALAVLIVGYHLDRLVPLARRSPKGAAALRPSGNGDVRTAAGDRPPVREVANGAVPRDARARH